MAKSLWSREVRFFTANGKSPLDKIDEFAVALEHKYGDHNFGLTAVGDFRNHHDLIRVIVFVVDVTGEERFSRKRGA